MKKHHLYILYSISISAIIILWDIVFVFNHFPANKFLAFAMMAQVEIAFIALPYFIDQSSDSAYKIWFNKLMRAIFFTAAMTPAALGITDQFLIKMKSEIRSEPVKPTMPIYDKQIDKDIKIERWYVNQGIDVENHKKILDDLINQRTQYRENKAKYDKDIVEYPEKKRQYDEYQSKNKITNFFDKIMLVLGFIIMFWVRL